MCCAVTGIDGFDPSSYEVGGLKAGECVWRVEIFVIAPTWNETAG